MTQKVHGKSRSLEFSLVGGGEHRFWWLVRHCSCWRRGQYIAAQNVGHTIACRQHWQHARPHACEVTRVKKSTIAQVFAQRPARTQTHRLTKSTWTHSNKHVRARAHHTQRATRSARLVGYATRIATLSECCEGAAPWSATAVGLAPPSTSDADLGVPWAPVLH